ncbi:MAG TPA: ABC-2 family transporter protein [Phycisphaerae bacterium]|nr:ABC-2 family transporter protein [Phycisphaerae bacterium]HRY66439.1 ABC-2 family transporter protein [Phycisphaerae bacterium]HSA25853.1 ABC-2 family transporter protein [Phycisphaerae bacterium]
MLHYFRILGLFARVSIQNDAAYRADFFSSLVMSLLGFTAELLNLWAIFSNVRSFNNWSVPQMVVLIGIFKTIQGMIGLFIAPNMRMIMEDIRDGRLDFAILKPMHVQFYASVRRLAFWRATDVVLGLAMIVVGCSRLDVFPTVGMVSSFLVMLAAGMVIIYSFWLVLATCAFWFTRLSNIEMVFWNLFEAGRYPVDIFPFGIRFALTYVVPLAFLTTYPAAALTGRMEFNWLVVTVVLAGVSLVVSARFWQLGLRHYSGASA